jgi:hypothetical protein
LYQPLGPEYTLAMIQSRSISLFFILLSLTFLGLLAGCNSQPELTPEQKHQAKMKNERDQFEKMQAWVDESSKREKRASTLQGFLKKDLCKALTLGQRFDKLKTQETVSHNLSAHPQLPLGQPEQPMGIKHLNTGVVASVSAKEFTGALRDHFKMFGLIKICDVHTHFYEPQGAQEVIQTTLNLSGFDILGHVLEEHLTLELAFDSKNNLNRFQILEGYLVDSPQELFSDITESIVGSGKFDEEGFSPLKLGAAGNLDFGGLSTVDVNRDGLLDIYVARSGPNLLYMQNPDGSFSEEASKLGVADAGNSRGVVFADFDGDGDLDLLVANMTLTPETAWPVQSYRQGEDGIFVRNTIEAFQGKSFVSQYTHIAVIDVDGDKDLDAFIGGYGNSMKEPANHIVEANNGRENLLLINNGKGVFSEEAQTRGLGGTDWSYAAAFADVNGDNAPDLYVANDWGINRFYINDGQGTFRESASEYNLAHPGAGMGVIWTDVDGNGALDLYVSNMFSNAGNRIVPFAERQSPEVKNALLASAGGNNLFLNPKPGAQNDATSAYQLRDGGWAWGAIAFDYDLDGDEDIYQTNGYYTGTRTKDL